MSGAPIILTFYNPETNEVERTFTQAFIPWRIMKQVTKLMKANIDPENLDEKTIDQLNGLIVDVFGGRFTVEELENKTVPSEVLSTLQAIMTKINGVMPEGNPTKQA